MRTIVAAFFLFISSLAAAQPADTLRFMTYNLLFYGEVTSFCTSSNNNINAKDDAFKTVAAYVQPDIVLVNEMGASAVYAERILAKVLNVDGETRFKRANVQNNGFSNLVNGIFYDKNKLELLQQEKVSKALNNSDIVRVIDVVTFYYKDPFLEEDSDTTFIHLVGMHLKAGGSSSDRAERDLATEAVMEFLKDNYAPGNYILAGDLNIESSSEAAFQNLKAGNQGAYRFVDPLISGSWGGTSSFSFAHTQSTHTDGSGCASGGGLDDRFDLILLSQDIMSDTAGSVHYIEDSYNIPGNDANHYNQSILTGTNNSVPSDVLNALYDLSDHLPVTVDLRVELIEPDTTPPAGIHNHQTTELFIDAFGDQLRMRSDRAGASFEVFDVMGRSLMRGTMNGRSEWLLLSHLTSGTYIVRLAQDGNQVSRKVMVLH